MTFDMTAEARLQSWEQDRRDATVHARKELNEYFSEALDNLGGFTQLTNEVVRQHKAIKANGGSLKDEDGLFRRGILDLTKFKLSDAKIAELKEDARLDNELIQTKKQVAVLEAQAADRHQNRDAGMFAADALGEFYPVARDALGSDEKVLKVAASEMKRLEAKGIKLRDHRNQIQSGDFNLKAFGLNEEQVAAREAQRGDAQKAGFADKFAKVPPETFVLGASKLGDGSVLGK